MDLNIIINVVIGVAIYNLILSSIGRTVLIYFLEKSDTVQKEKKSFQDRLKEKMEEKK